MKSTVDKRRSGTSALRITRVGFGAWAIGDGGWSFGWAAEDSLDTIGAIRRALDLGHDWIEAAEVQGLGDSDEFDGDVCGLTLEDQPAGEIEGWIDAATLVLSRATLGEIATAIGRTGAGKRPRLSGALAA